MVSVHQEDLVDGTTALFCFHIELRLIALTPANTRFTTRQRTILLACLISLVPCGPLRAQAGLPFEVQVPLLLKVLSYDRALNRNGSGDLVLAVLYDAANSTLTAARTAFTRAVRASDVAVVNGRTIKVVEINVAAGHVGTAMKEKGVTAAYLTPGLDARLEQLVRAAVEAQVTLMSGSERYVKQGVAVGVGAAGGKPEILINLRTARTAGADLPAPLLKIATVIQ
jgi:hypothetical protein